MPAIGPLPSFAAISRAVKYAAMARDMRSSWTKAGVIFIHVPRTAGTSISYAVYGRFTDHMRAVDIRRGCPGHFKRLPAFALTRNPWDRLISAYHHIRQNGTPLSRPHPCADYQLPAFGSFERFIEEWLLPKDPIALDPVFQPQHPYVYGRRKGRHELIVDFLGKYEELDRTRDYLAALLLRPIVISHLNASPRFPDNRVYFPQARLRNLVGDYYRRDADLFDYHGP